VGLTTSQTEAAIRQAWGDSQVKTALLACGRESGAYGGIQITPQRSPPAAAGRGDGQQTAQAVAVRGHGPIRIAAPERLRELALEMQQRLRANAIYPAVSAHGTPGIVSLMNALGRFPTQNFRAVA